MSEERLKVNTFKAFLVVLILFVLTIGPVILVVGVLETSGSFPEGTKGTRLGQEWPAYVVMILMVVNHMFLLAKYNDEINNYVLEDQNAKTN